jgi:hypothetical protein
VVSSVPSRSNSAGPSIRFSFSIVAMPAANGTALIQYEPV